MIAFTIDCVSPPWFFLPDEFMWTPYTATFASLSAAALTNSVTLATLPAKTVLHAVAIKHDVAFSGGAIASYVLSVGVGATADKYASAFNVFQAVGATVGQLSHALFCDNFSSAVAVSITATSTVGMLNAATAGSVTIWLLTSLQ